MTSSAASVAGVVYYFVVAMHNIPMDEISFWVFATRNDTENQTFNIFLLRFYLALSREDQTYNKS